MTLETLLQELNSRKKSQREAALKQARELSPEQLLELAEMEAREYRRRKRNYVRVAGVIVTFVVIAFLYCLFFAHNRFMWQSFQVVNYINIIALAYLPRRGRQSISQLIEQIDDTRMIGPLLTILVQTDRDPNVQQTAVRALTRLLPQIRADQVEMLTPEQRQGLLIILKGPYGNVPLTLAVLKALEQVGDEKAVSVVEHLAQEPAATPNMRQVRDAARECLHYLQRNMERSKQAQTLLRASDASTTATPEVLLRPAMPDTDRTAPAELLRAASVETPASPTVRTEAAPVPDVLHVGTAEQ